MKSPIRQITDTRHVCYRRWHVDPAVSWWRVWVIFPDGDSSWSTGATVQAAYLKAVSNIRRCRPRHDLPRGWQQYNQRFGTHGVEQTTEEQE